MRGYPKQGYLARVKQPRFSQIMKERGWTLRSMAMATGLSRSILSDFASGKKRITGETVERIANKCRGFPSHGNEWWVVVTPEDWATRARPIPTTPTSDKGEIDVAARVLGCVINQEEMIKAMLDKGWSMADLGNATGLTPQTLYNVRSGRHFTRARTAKAIADALGMDVLDLFKVEREDA